MQLNKNALLLRALSSNADTLGSNAAKNEFPVLLRSIAERRRVTSVEFCPLLVDAMLTTHPHGFRILFNSNGSNAITLQEEYENESNVRLMPHRLRFSLAHELAHTLFYELSDEAPKVAKQFRSGGGKTVLENLERSCDKLAARLLLPTPILRVAFKNIKTITPKSLLELALKAGVSIETLVRRLDNNNFRYFRGCIALVKQTGDNILISAIAKNTKLNIARDLRLMRNGERWQLVAHDGTPIHPANLPAQSFTTLAVETPGRAVSEQRYQITASEAGHFDGTVSYLIVFEEIETH